MNKSERKIVIITRETRADGLIRQFNNIAQAEFYVEKMGGDFTDYRREATEYKTAVSNSYGRLEQLARVQRVDREFIPQYIFGPDDIVVVIGQDGLVANTLKYLRGQPLIAVNPDPARYDGILLPFAVRDLESVVRDVLAGHRQYKQVTMAQATLNNGQTMLAVNDFFIGRNTHVSARYNLNVGDRNEDQSSSGIIVSTGLGRTGWLKSVITGASGVAAALGGDMSAAEKLTLVSGSREWAGNTLYYSVREPFPSKVTGASLVFGQVPLGKPLTVTSQMPENGVIFSDGIEQDFLQFTSGITATVSVAPQKGRLVV